jgi:hypothetical protein
MQAEINKKKSPFVHKKKAELKALGALRLIKRAGGFTENGGIAGKVSDGASDICSDARVAPLFSTHRRWSVACRLAHQVLEDYKRHLRLVGVIRSN